QIARFARQLILWGGAVILGMLVGGGLFVLISSLHAVLYPENDSSSTLLIAGLICFAIGAVCAVVFRLRGSTMAGMVGLALVTAAVLSIIGFGAGDLLKAIFDGTRFWREVKSISVGIIVVEIITLAFAAAFVVMYGVVWLVGKIPNMGSVDVKLALRNLTTRKPRTASTMLGLIVGVGALSLITLTTSAVTDVLETRLETDAGGNVFVLTRDVNTAETVKKRLESRLSGVKSFTQFQFYMGRILLVDGEEPELEGFEGGDVADGNRREFGQVENEEGIGFGFTTIDPRTNQLQFEMKRGRFFNAEDVGKPYLVMREPFQGSFNDRLGLDVGSTITWLMKPPPSSGEQEFEITFTVIGVIDRDSEQFSVGDSLQVPMGAVPDYMPPDSIFTIADIEDAHVDEAMVEFAQISNVLAIELDFIVQLIERLLDQLAAIPTLVAVLALVSGIAIIANTVALDTQERRRQIGIMKAVGLKGYRVLGQIMFENALIGFVAGAIGVLIGLIAVLLVGVFGEAESVEQMLNLKPALYLIVMAVVVSLVATLISAWTAASESPMEVLRYE
ncbi:MAG: FtsX-like permease family protein, partial [Anaerolineae bacterium]|nr:FtsX-like permease family protein [Anaerolineae bacterium]